MLIALLATPMTACAQKAQTAPPVVEKEMSEGVVKTTQLSQAVQPNDVNPSVGISEI